MFCAIRLQCLLIYITIATIRTVSNFEVAETMPETGTDTCTQLVEEDMFAYKLRINYNYIDS